MHTGGRRHEPPERMDPRFTRMAKGEARGREHPKEKRRSWPISRVLSKTIIHLGCVSPRTSSDLPGSTCGPHVRYRSEDLHRLPPYLVLLQAGFAMPPSVTTGAVRSYRTISPLPDCTCAQPGGLFSVALSVGSRPPGVTWRLALGARTFLHACAQRLPGQLRRGWWRFVGGEARKDWPTPRIYPSGSTPSPARTTHYVSRR
jgi:hypothetical protein